jgi:hypothetical protein
MINKAINIHPRPVIERCINKDTALLGSAALLIGPNANSAARLSRALSLYLCNAQ